MPHFHPHSLKDLTCAMHREESAAERLYISCKQSLYLCSHSLHPIGDSSGSSSSQIPKSEVPVFLTNIPNTTIESAVLGKITWLPRQKCLCFF
ncbi:hypothetical protein FKM82_006862 [Ascaphus truei]